MDKKNTHIFGKGTVRIPAASASTTIAHSLGYIPAHLLFTKIGNEYCPVPFLSPSVVAPLSIYATLDDKDITIFKNNTTVAQDIYFIIFRERL